MIFLNEIRRRDDVPHDVNSYPFTLPVVKALKGLSFTTPVTFLIGENGSGKSTLLEAIAHLLGMNQHGGGRNFRFGDTEATPELARHFRLSRSVERPKDDFFLRAETLFNLASEVERLRVTGYGDRGLHNQSHGETFLTLLVERFRGNGLYLCDEPEAALSPARQLAALLRIHDLVQLRSQFIIATHSPILMSLPGATILEIAESGEIGPVAFRETGHFTLLREFVNDPEGMLARLLA